MHSVQTDFTTKNVTLFLMMHNAAELAVNLLPKIQYWYVGNQSKYCSRQ